VSILAKFIAKKPEKEVISMRISTDMLKIVDDKATEIGISRNELINQMIQYALENMDDSQK
jgi:metal-responsive CopG/Arc/MetJ family transcriptional regulator